MRIGRIMVILLLFSILFFLGCTEKVEKESGNKQHILNELKIGTGWDATRPGDYQPFGMWEPACLIYESLVNIDEDCRPVPCLADKWEVSNDGLVYTFSLHKGIRFHDATPLNANAVKINFERLGKINWQALKRVVKQVKVKDEFTVQFILSRPAPLFFIHLAGSGCGIIAPAAIEAKSSNNKSGRLSMPEKTPIAAGAKGIKGMPSKIAETLKGAPKKNAIRKEMEHEAKSYVVARAIGTGPYKWDEESYQRAKSFRVVRNDDYWQGKPVFKKITWLIIPDPSARTIALESGEIEMTGQSPNASLTEENIIALKRNDKIRLSKANNWGTRLVIVNHTRPPFDNINVRRALRYAIDYNGLQTVFGELATVCPGPFGPNTPFTHPAIKLSQYNPEKTEAILDQEGLLDTNGDGFREYNGKTIEIGILTSKNTAMGVLLCEYLEKVGIKASLRPKESGVIFQVLDQMDYDIAVHPNIPSFYLDLYETFHSHGRWSIHLDNPKIDELLDQYVVCSDYERFKQVSEQIQEEIHKQAIILFAINESKLAAYHKELGEFVYPPEEWVGAVQEIWRIK
ncbi:MAG: hypothetical protein JRF53_15545 [Deltaproteobacteria bacterium]|nr:hypothetical protein [Deltaproteobacteria bacterium]